ncbi:MAG TPA: hypothetical protein PKZ53_13920, partial [Acidobacteriota bacterium]|nr:hypothetical protein [Acidobacteriota bacterium]
APVSSQPPLRGEGMSTEPNHFLHSQFLILNSSFFIPSSFMPLLLTGNLLQRNLDCEKRGLHRK